MAKILTFLGKGGTGRTTVAAAAARQLASQGQRVLLATDDSGPGLGLVLGTPLSPGTQELSPNLHVCQLQATEAISRHWESLKQQESKYLRTPLLHSIYAQELGILPGMDGALVLNALRELEASGLYDVILYDGQASQATLRLLGMPEILKWYLDKAAQVFAESDLGSLVPLVQPIVSTVVNFGSGGDTFTQPAHQAGEMLERGRQAVHDPERVAAFLVTSPDRAAVAQALYLWGSAQQVSLTVKGVLLNHTQPGEDAPPGNFAPLPITPLPYSPRDWQPLAQALPDLLHSSGPAPLVVDVAAAKVSVFLPGLDKKQVKLTQQVLGLTIEAADQRRNLVLPVPLRHREIAGAKFQDGYLVISFA